MKRDYYNLNFLLRMASTKPIYINELLENFQEYISEIKEFNLQLSAQESTKISTTQKKTLEKDIIAIHDYLKKITRKKGLSPIINKRLYCDILCDIMTAEEKMHRFNLATEDANLILKAISQKGDGTNPYFDVVFTNGFEDVGIQALYTATLNSYKEKLAKGEDTTEIEKRLEAIIEHDTNRVINPKSEYEILTSFFQSLSDRIAEKYGDKSSEEIMSRLLQKENVEELIKFIFPEGVYHPQGYGNHEANDNNDNVDPTNPTDIPSGMIGVERFRYIQKHYGITKLFMGSKNDDKSQAAFSDCEGTFIIETDNPDIVIVESFYEVHGDKVVESKDKATYILSKEYAKELIDSAKGRAETRREASSDAEKKKFFRPVSHFRDPKRYYSLLDGAYDTVYKNMVQKCAAEIEARLSRDLSPEERKEQSMQAAIEELAKRKQDAQTQNVVGKVDKMRQSSNTNHDGNPGESENGDR